MTAEARAPGEEEGGALAAWALGGPVFCGTVDVLAAVLLAIADVPALRPGVLALAAAGFLSYAGGTFSWGRPRSGLVVSGAVQAALAAALFLALPAWLRVNLPPVVGAAAAAHALAAGLAFAGRGPSRAREGDGAPRGAILSVFENFESVVVALVFALVVRHFAVEAFKIPTKSMSPTLFGDDPRGAPGDRVLVTKWPAILSGPGRYQVWVFRYPLYRPQNYIKRVVGLPGETIDIREGDVYADGVITRKPPRTREAMWFPVWPDPARARGAAPPSPWQGEGWRRDGDAFVVSGAKGTSLLRYVPEITDRTPDGGGASRVGDARVRFRVDGPEPGTTLKVAITGRGGLCTVEIAVGGQVTLQTPGGSLARAPSPSLDGVDVEVALADLEFSLRVDGREVLRADVSEPAEPVPSSRFGAALGVERGGARFSGVRLDRDVFYTSANYRTHFEVPAGHYLFLGDNSKASQDGRAWAAMGVREKGEGGRTFYVDALLAEGRRPFAEHGGVLDFTDTEGVFRSLPADRVERLPTRPAPFVPEEDLVGRAFVVFWPLPFTAGGAGRLKFLP